MPTTVKRMELRYGKKESVVNVPITVQARNEMDDYCAQTGMKRTEFAREAILEKIERVKADKAS